MCGDNDVQHRIITFDVFKRLSLTIEISTFLTFWADVPVSMLNHSPLSFRRYWLQELDPRARPRDLPQPFARLLHCLRDAHAPQIGNAIFWRTERFRRKRNAGLFWLSRTPIRSVAIGISPTLSVNRYGLKIHAQASRSVYAKTYRLKTALTEKSTRRTRKQSTGSSSRLLPVLQREVPKCSSAFSTATLVGRYRNLTQQFTNMFVRLATEIRHVETFHGLGGKRILRWTGSSRPFGEMDWLLCRDQQQRVQVISCTIARDTEPPVFASDHYPVVAEFVLV